MGIFKTLFNAAIFEPLYNALILIYNLVPDIGFAIILLTVIIRLTLNPISKKGLESQKKMRELQPKIKELQKKYSDDKQLQSQKVLELYQKEKINPASGCLPLIVQMIFLIALYRVFLIGLNAEQVTDNLYSFISNPERINPISLGFFDLSAPSIQLTIIAAALQFWQSKLMLGKMDKNKEDSKQKKESSSSTEEPNFSEIMQKQMLFLGPIMTLLIGSRFPSGLVVYWIVTTVFMIFQQYQIEKKDGKCNKKIA